MKLSQVLFSQGFGARRECEGLILGGHVTLAGQVCDDPWREVDVEGLVIGVRGALWPYHAKALVAAEQAGRLRVLAKAQTPPERDEPAALAAAGARAAAGRPA